MQKLFAVMHRTFGWSKELLDDIIDICISLTNFHIRLHPLREEDRDYYFSVLANLKANAEKKQNKGRDRQRRYRARRSRLQRALEDDFEEAFGSGNAHVGGVIENVGADGGADGSDGADDGSDGGAEDPLMDTEDEDSIKARELSDSMDSSDDDEVFAAINRLRPPPQDKRASNKRSKVSMVTQSRRS